MGGDERPREFFLEGLEEVLDYVRFESRLNKIADDQGLTVREHLEVAARQGSEQALLDLQPPEYPEQFDYLISWAQELYGRSGLGLSGIAPLSHAEIEAWAKLRDIDLSPYEVQALVEIDAAIRVPEEKIENKEETTSKEVKSRRNYFKKSKSE